MPDNTDALKNITTSTQAQNAALGTLKRLNILLGHAITAEQHLLAERIKQFKRELLAEVVQMDALLQKPDADEAAIVRATVINSKKFGDAFSRDTKVNFAKITPSRLN